MMSHSNVFKQHCFCEPAICEDLDLHVAIFNYFRLQSKQFSILKGIWQTIQHMVLEFFATFFCIYVHGGHWWACQLRTSRCSYGHLLPLVDPRGAPGTHAPLGVQILSFSCSFRQKNWKIIALLGVGAAPWGKSWIRHWLHFHLMPFCTSVCLLNFPLNHIYLKMCFELSQYGMGMPTVSYNKPSLVCCPLVPHLYLSCIS